MTTLLLNLFLPYFESFLTFLKEPYSSNKGAEETDSLNWLEHRIGQHLGNLTGQLAVEFGH